MNEIIPQDVIEQKILLIRGQMVMLDRDLAALYNVETKILNKVVRRNIERFPSDFMFQLTIDEFDNLKFQIGTSSWGGIRKLPLVFTETGKYTDNEDIYKNPKNACIKYSTCTKNKSS